MSAASSTVQDSLVLPDGRRLSYSAAGPRDGFPVVYLHGGIGSPVRFGSALEGAIDALGIRYLMVNRPGFAGSDQHSGRRVVDFADDVRELADALQMARFAVVGVSAGGPYALACADVLRERVTAVALVGSLAPLLGPHAMSGMALRYRLPLAVLRRAPRLAARLVEAVVHELRRRPGLAARLIAAGAPDADRGTLSEAPAREAAVRNLLAATAGGAQPIVEDYLVCCRPWGFETSGVSTPVHLWHGMLDRLVPVEHALQLAISLPDCRTSLDPDEGHFFFRRRLLEVLGPLVGRDRELPGGQRRLLRKG